MQYKTVTVVDDSKLRTDLETLIKNPRAQAQMTAVCKIISLRLSHSIFGTMPSWDWAIAQLSDEDRAALAKDAEKVERLLPEAQ